MPRTTTYYKSTSKRSPSIIRKTTLKGRGKGKASIAGRKRKNIGNTTGQRHRRRATTATKNKRKRKLTKENAKFLKGLGLRINKQ